MSENVNDNDSGRAGARPREPDAHGQAAMLLIESLIHGLVARSILSLREAVEIVDVAAAVRSKSAADLGDSPATMMKSLSLLESIRASLQLDMSVDDGVSDGQERP